MKASMANINMSSMNSSMKRLSGWRSSSSSNSSSNSAGSDTVAGAAPAEAPKTIGDNSTKLTERHPVEDESSGSGAEPHHSSGEHPAAPGSATSTGSGTTIRCTHCGGIFTPKESEHPPECPHCNKPNALPPGAGGGGAKEGIGGKKMAALKSA